MRWLVILLFLATSASAQLPITGVGRGQSGGGVVTPCAVGALNVSLSGATAGCNIPQMMLGVFAW